MVLFGLLFHQAGYTDEDVVDMDGYGARACRAREIEEMIDYVVDSIDLVAYQRAELIAKLRIVIAFGQQVCECFYGDERILDSWAMLAASWPALASRSERRTCDSSFFIAV